MQYLFSTLTVVTFAPLLGVVVLLFLRPEQKNTIRWVALITSLATFVLSLVMLAQFLAKVGVEVVFTPVTYKIVGWLKRAEDEDYYDRKTDFNPFRLKA